MTRGQLLQRGLRRCLTLGMAQYLLFFSSIIVSATRSKLSCGDGGLFGSSCGEDWMNAPGDSWEENMLAVFNREMAFTGTDNVYKNNWYMFPPVSDARYQRFKFYYDKTLFGGDMAFIHVDAGQSFDPHNVTAPLRDGERIYQVFWQTKRHDFFHEYYLGLAHYPRYDTTGPEKNALLSHANVTAQNLQNAGINSFGKCINPQVCGKPPKAFTKASTVMRHDMMRVLAKDWKEPQFAPYAEVQPLWVGDDKDPEYSEEFAKYNAADIFNIPKLYDTAGKKSEAGLQAMCQLEFMVATPYQMQTGMHQNYFNHPGFNPYSFINMTRTELESKYALMADHFESIMGTNLVDEYHEFQPVILHRPVPGNMIELARTAFYLYEKDSKYLDELKKTRPGLVAQAMAHVPPPVPPGAKPVKEKKEEKKEEKGGADKKKGGHKKKKSSSSSSSFVEVLQGGDDDDDDKKDKSAGGRKGRGDEEDGRWASTTMPNGDEPKDGSKLRSFPYKSLIAVGPSCASVELDDKNLEDIVDWSFTYPSGTSNNSGKKQPAANKKKDMDKGEKKTHEKKKHDEKKKKKKKSTSSFLEEIGPDAAFSDEHEGGCSAEPELESFDSDGSGSTDVTTPSD